MLVGTKDSEVVEVTVADKDNPTVITQVTSHTGNHGYVVISVQQVVQSHAQRSTVKLA